MSRRHVSFHTPSPPRVTRRGGDPAYDSGLGSLSSEQASKGGRPDRRFTDEDYSDQLYNVAALQEALGQSNKTVELLSQECRELSEQVKEGNKRYRDLEKSFRSECERNEQLVEEDRLKADHIRLQAETIQQLNHLVDQVVDERDRFRQDYLSIRGGTGDRPDRPGQTDKSGDEVKDRLRERMKHPEDSSASSSQRRSRRPSTAKPGARSSSKKPYIEKLPDPSSRRHSINYKTTSLDTASMSHMEPATHQIPRSSSSYTADIPTGDYVAYPLKEPHSRRRV